jgi:hypothetical protein
MPSPSRTDRPWTQTVTVPALPVYADGLKAKHALMRRKLAAVNERNPRRAAASSNTLCYGEAAALFWWDDPALFAEATDAAVEGKDLHHAIGFENTSFICAAATPTGEQLVAPPRHVQHNVPLPSATPLPLFIDIGRQAFFDDAARARVPHLPVSVGWCADPHGTLVEQQLQFPRFPPDGTVQLLMHLCAARLGCDWQRSAVAMNLAAVDLEQHKSDMLQCVCRTWVMTVVRGGAIESIVVSCSTPPPKRVPETHTQHGAADERHLKTGARCTVSSQLLRPPSTAKMPRGGAFFIRLQPFPAARVVSVSGVSVATGFYTGAPFLIRAPTSLEELRLAVQAVRVGINFEAPEGVTPAAKHVRRGIGLAAGDLARAAKPPKPSDDWAHLAAAVEAVRPFNTQASEDRVNTFTADEVWPMMEDADFDDLLHQLDNPVIPSKFTLLRFLVYTS